MGIRDFYRAGDKLIMNCPIHQGDNVSAFNINVDPESNFYGRWFCNTRKCHSEFSNDVVGFVQGCREKMGVRCSFVAAIQFLQEFCRGIEGDFNVREVLDDNVVRFLTRTKLKKENQISRNKVRESLLIPSDYYQNRGFSPQVLDELDVGLCTREGSPMFNRVVFPVYEEDNVTMIGCVGRRTDEVKDCKWINSKGFNKANHLYNYNKAAPRVKDRRAIILVEGQGDAMRMYEAGIINTVGLFGCSITDGQEYLLQKSGAWDIIIATDNDPAGIDAYDKIQFRLKNLFNIHRLEVPTKDIGDLTVQEVNSIIKPQIRKFI